MDGVPPSKKRDNANTLLLETVPQGTKIIHDGPIEIRGSIGADSQITSTSGGILAHDDIARNVTLKAISPAHIPQTANLLLADLAIHLQKDRLNITPDKIKSPEDLSAVTAKTVTSKNIAPLAGIDLRGIADENLTLVTTDSIHAAKDLKDGLTAIAYGAFHGTLLGNNCRLHLGGDCSLLITGQGTIIRAGQNITFETSGSKSEFIAKENITVTSLLGADSTAYAGKHLKIERTSSSCLCQSNQTANLNRLGFKSRLIARENAHVDLCEPGSKIFAEQKVIVSHPNEQSYIWEGKKKPTVNGMALPRPRGWRARKKNTPFSI